MCCVGPTVRLSSAQDQTDSHSFFFSTQANSVVMEEIHVPSWLHRFIIGRKGENIRTITENLPKLHLEFKEESDVILLEGPQAEVLEAKKKVESFAQDLVRMSPINIYTCNRHTISFWPKVEWVDYKCCPLELAYENCWKDQERVSFVDRWSSIQRL